MLEIAGQSPSISGNKSHEKTKRRYEAAFCFCVAFRFENRAALPSILKLDRPAKSRFVLLDELTTSKQR
jgi:hypothetical protein